MFNNSACITIQASYYFKRIYHNINTPTSYTTSLLESEKNIEALLPVEVCDLSFGP